MITKLSLVVMTVLISSVGHTGDRPVIALPRTYAFEDVVLRESTPVNHAALLRDGTRWRAELFNRSENKILVWIGDGSNILLGATVTDNQKARFPKLMAFTLDSVYEKLNDQQCEPYQGIVVTNGISCWKFLSADGVEILINTNTSLIVQSKWGNRMIKYIPIAVDALDREALLSSELSSNALLRHLIRGTEQGDGD